MHSVDQGSFFSAVKVTREDVIALGHRKLETLSLYNPMATEISFRGGKEAGA
jgi:hypothetical protein